MSNAKQETIADIVREMRTLGRLDGESTDKIPRSLQALGLRTYADRIKAAHEREKRKPIRNCDRYGTANEAFGAFEKMCFSTRSCKDCPIYTFSKEHGVSCRFVWLYEEAVKEEAK